MAYREFYETPVQAPPQIDLSQAFAAVAHDIRSNTAMKQKKAEEREKQRNKEFEDMDIQEAAERDKSYYHENYLVPKTAKIIQYQKEGRDFNDPLVQKEFNDMNKIASLSKSQAEWAKDRNERISAWPSWFDKGGAKARVWNELDTKNIEERDFKKLDEEIDPVKNPNLVDNKVFTKEFLSNYQQQKASKKADIERETGQSVSDSEINSQLGIVFDDKKGFHIPKEKEDDVLDWYFSFGGEQGGAVIQNKLQKNAEQQILQEAEQYAKEQEALTGRKLDAKALAKRWMDEPDSNPVNSKSIGQRVRESALKDIVAQANLDHKYSYKHALPSASSEGGSGGGGGRRGVTATEATYTPTTSTTRGEVPLRDDLPKGITIVGFATSDGTGKPVLLQTGNPSRFNTFSGAKEPVTKGVQNFYMTNVGIAPFDASGNPVIEIASQDAEEMIKAIQSKPDSWFANKKPSMGIVMNGYSADKNNILNEIQKEEEKIERDLTSSITSLSPENRAALIARNQTLIALREELGRAESEEELMDIVGKRVLGVLESRMHQVIKADDNDKAQIKNAIGKDLRDRSQWSADMLRLDEAYKAKYQQAKANNFGKAAPQQAQASQPQQTRDWSKYKR